MTLGIVSTFDDFLTNESRVSRVQILFLVPCLLVAIEAIAKTLAVRYLA